MPTWLNFQPCSPHCLGSASVGVVVFVGNYCFCRFLRGQRHLDLRLRLPRPRRNQCAPNRSGRQGTACLKKRQAFFCPRNFSAGQKSSCPMVFSCSPQDPQKPAFLALCNGPWGKDLFFCLAKQVRISSSRPPCGRIRGHAACTVSLYPCPEECCRSASTASPWIPGSSALS